MIGSILSALFRRQRGPGAPDPFAPPLIQMVQQLRQKQLQAQQMAQQQPQPQQQELQPIQQPAPTQMQDMQDLLQGMVRAISGQPMARSGGNQLNPLIRALMNQNHQSFGDTQTFGNFQTFGGQPYVFGNRLPFGVGRPIGWIRRMFGGW